jgi:hypothetical protein
MDTEDLKNFIGFGIAGNFAHHLVQAGEASDFVNVEVEEEHAPKGIFPFYLPKHDSFLGIYPLSNKYIVTPKIDNGNLHMEPEVALLCDIVYQDDKVIDVVPHYFTAYNDCSIRKPDAKKISQKKNWGKDTKGISKELIKIDKFSNGGIMDSYYIASFLKRDDKIYPYGEDSAVLTYNYFYEKLINWIINKLNTQKDEGPLEDLSSYIKELGYPKNMIISIGATSYTEFGETGFLKEGDETFVVVYDKNKYCYDEILEHILNQSYSLENSSVLHQEVIA